jgi:hypothetical protein
MKPGNGVSTSSPVVIGIDISIVVVVLLPFHEGLDVDRRGNPWLERQRRKQPADKMRAQAGFHAEPTIHGGSSSKASLRASRLIFLRKAIFPSAPNPTR